MLGYILSLIVMTFMMSFQGGERFRGVVPMVVKIISLLILIVLPKEIFVRRRRAQGREQEMSGLLRGFRLGLVFLAPCALWFLMFIFVMSGGEHDNGVL